MIIRIERLVSKKPSVLLDTFALLVYQAIGMYYSNGMKNVCRLADLLTYYDLSVK